MSNIYVSGMKDALKNYYKKAKDFEKQVQLNNEKFSPEYAEKENAQVALQRVQAYDDTVRVITNIYRTVREALAIASFPSVELLSADRSIFESGIELAPETVNAYIERYTKPYNPTMLMYIKTWIDKQNSIEAAQHKGGVAMRNKYDMQIMLPSDRVGAYKKFGDSAVKIAAMIRDNGNIMIQPLEIEHFCDETLAGDLLAVIGDGMELSDYKVKRVPESAKHIFDDVKLEVEQTQAQDSTAQNAA